MAAMNRREFLVGGAAMSVAWPAMARQAAEDPTAATVSLRAAVALASRDPERPVYHFRPPANWTNDPNGTIYYKGWHHLFYQLNPAEPRGGNQHWGHARSRDLVNWEHLPIALWPLTSRGERAIYSGGATLGPDGRPLIFYTSIGHEFPQQWIATPQDDDLIGWDRPARNPILTVTAHGALTPSQWRDPFLFSQGRDTYMVCGGNVNGGRGGGGAVFLYKAANADLTDWRYAGVVYQQRDRQYFNIECPNLFPGANKGVCCCRRTAGPVFRRHTRPLEACVRARDAGRDRSWRRVRQQHLGRHKGRTILWLWGRTRNAPDRGWRGVDSCNGCCRSTPTASYGSSRRPSSRRCAAVRRRGRPSRPLRASRRSSRGSRATPRVGGRHRDGQQQRPGWASMSDAAPTARPRRRSGSCLRAYSP